MTWVLLVEQRLMDHTTGLIGCDSSKHKDFICVLLFLFSVPWRSCLRFMTDEASELINDEKLMH